MTDRTSLDHSAADRARASALDQIDRAERRFKTAFYGAAAFEALFLASFLLLADLHERIHILILLGSVGAYGIVILGLFALGAHVTRCAERVMHALDSKPV
jgi:hypothetical protein